MKVDRLTTLLGILAAITGIMGITTGRPLMGGIILLISFGIFWNRGGGSINERSIFENEVRTALGTDEIYSRLKDTDTPLGRPWIAEHKGYPGKSIVFGPSIYKDCIAISRKSDRVNVKHITLLDNIIRAPEDEYRFADVVDTKETVVNPRNYSIFAKYKLISVMMVRHLREIIEGMTASSDRDIPGSIDQVNFYYHNSSEGWFRDEDGRDVLRVENSYSPFICKVSDGSGDEMASVAARRTDARGRVSGAAGFDIYADGGHYGEITPFREGRTTGFKAVTPEGEFVLKLFPACSRANISCNYTVEKDGELKAVIGGSPRLIFNDMEERQNDLVLSYDDEYLVLYAVLEIFIMTYNSSFLK